MAEKRTGLKTLLFGHNMRIARFTWLKSPLPGRIHTITLMVAAFAFVFIFAMASSVAASDCPYGEVDCEYPGSCGRYVDSDGNGICDHSETPGEEMVLAEQDAAQAAEAVNADAAGDAEDPALPEVQADDRGSSEKDELEKEDPEKERDEELKDAGMDVHDLITGSELKHKTVAEVAGIYGIDSRAYSAALGNSLGHSVKEKDSFQLLHDNYGLEPSLAKDIAAALASGEDPALPDTDAAGSGSKEKLKYPVFLLVILLVLAYIVTAGLSAKRVISVAAHRKFWNLILTVSFIVSGVLGLLLVIRINYGLTPRMPFNALWWHVEAGVVMAVVSFFHIGWHWRYYASIIRSGKRGG